MSALNRPGINKDVPVEARLEAICSRFSTDPIRALQARKGQQDILRTQRPDSDDLPDDAGTTNPARPIAARVRHAEDRATANDAADTLIRPRFDDDPQVEEAVKRIAVVSKTKLNTATE